MNPLMYVAIILITVSLALTVSTVIVTGVSLVRYRKEMQKIDERYSAKRHRAERIA